VKRIIVVVLTALAIFCILAVLYFLLNPSGDGKLILNKIAIIFQSTQFLDYQIDINDVEEVEIMGAVDLHGTDKGNYIYTNKEKISGIIDYLNSIPLVTAHRDELPNMSPDITIQFSNAEKNQTGSIWVYGQVFIEDRISGELYRCKQGNQIIEEIEKLDLDILE